MVTLVSRPFTMTERLVILEPSRLVSKSGRRNLASSKISLAKLSLLKTSRRCDAGTQWPQSLIEFRDGDEALRRDRTRSSGVQL